MEVFHQTNHRSSETTNLLCLNRLQEVIYKEGDTPGYPVLSPPSRSYGDTNNNIDHQPRNTTHTQHPRTTNSTQRLNNTTAQGPQHSKPTKEHNINSTTQRTQPQKDHATKITNTNKQPHKKQHTHPQTTPTTTHYNPTGTHIQLNKNLTSTTTPKQPISKPNNISNKTNNPNNTTHSDAGPLDPCLRPSYTLSTPPSTSPRLLPVHATIKPPSSKTKSHFTISSTPSTLVRISLCAHWGYLSSIAAFHTCLLTLTFTTSILPFPSSEYSEPTSYERPYSLN
ncbi:mucin-2-like [Macrobrachium nipponense]|uniref:mucin-2-like n=1 Tax=Macrobrachium nipponense TaxID=159736 RepID=UPI0030C805FC